MPARGNVSVEPNVNHDGYPLRRRCNVSVQIFIAEVETKISFRILFQIDSGELNIRSKNPVLNGAAADFRYMSRLMGSAILNRKMRHNLAAN